jgi:thiamine biosynthesis protein ThiS
MGEEGMRIRVNGEEKSFDGPLTAALLLESLGLDPRLVVVEKNGVIVERSELGREEVGEGDVLEIVRLVGGG